MPKRRKESSEEKWLRKMKKYEYKLRAKRRRVVYSEDDEDDNDVQNQEHLDSDRALTPTEPLTPEEPNETPGSNENPGPSETPGPSTTESTEVPPAENTETDQFNPDLLRELGVMETEPVVFGDDIQPDIASIFQNILLNGLKKELKEELLKKYLFPKNVPLAKGPTLNLEIGAILVDTCKQRDKRLLAKQDQLGKVLSALGKGLSCLLLKNPDIPEIIRTLSDAGKLLADSHYAETDTRRSVIIPLIDKSLTESFKDRKRDTLLFGEKLGDLVKDSRGIKKTGQLMQATTANLNGKGPSTRLRPRNNNQQRAGGPKTAATTYQYPPSYHYGTPYPSRGRRAATHYPPPPPPPPPPRRQPPPAPSRRALPAPPARRDPAGRST